MKKEIELWQFIAAKLERKERVTLLVVAESKGSSPGRQGFKMALAGDEMCGSIGGGVMEVGLVESAKRKMESGKSGIHISKSELIEQVHRKNAENSSGMICSGKQTVIFKELNSSHLKVIKKLIQYIKNDRERYIQITRNTFEVYWMKMKDRQPNFVFKVSSSKNLGESDFVYEEKLGFKQNLYIVGGGHCALALSELMSKLDFHISLFDDRPKLNTLKKNKFAHEKKVIDTYEQIAGNIPSGISNYVVVMTLGYKSDETVIRALANKKFKYFGVLGSKAKMKTLLTSMKKEGFSKKYLDSIRTPIGLPINSRTPEEIAVSIVAEIIAVKNSRK